MPSKRRAATVSAEHDTIREAYLRAVRNVAALVLKLAKNEADLSDVRKARDRAEKAYDRARAVYSHGAEQDRAHALLTAQLAQIPAAEEAGRVIRDLERQKELARLNTEIRETRKRSRYD